MARGRAHQRVGPSREELELLEDLASIYAEVDALHSGSSCSASTECCRFGVTGREPYLTSIEVLAIERALARRGGPLPPKRRALPVLAGGADERTCSLLEAPGRCSVYESRPFGCRTFFCERATHQNPPSREAIRALARRVQDVASRHMVAGDAARPMTRVFRSHGSRA